MAAAPKYDAPEVMPSGKPARYISVNTDADMFGAGVGRAIQQFGATVTQVAGVFDANAEKLRSEAAKTSANQAFVDASLAAGEAEAGYFSTAGVDATAGYKPFLDNLKTIRESALANLSDPESQELFDKAFQSTMLSGANQGATHAAQQGKAAALSSAEARVEIAMNDSATKFADEGLFQSNLTVVNQQIVDQAKLNGWTPEVTLAKVDAARSLMWESRITSMAASDPLGAKLTFDRVRDDLNVESRLRIQNTVIQANRTTAGSQGKQYLMGGQNVDVRPQFREGVITAGRNPEADAFLIPRSNHGPGDITGMHPDTTNRLASLIAAAPPGISENITIFSGARSLERQAALYAKSGGSGMVAKPSPHAPHVRGDAADLGWKGGSFKSMPPEAVAWLHENAGRFGLQFRLGNEPWHIERAGGTRGAPNDSFVSRIQRAEGGGAGVYSPVGAAGIMQVMPDTARRVAASLGIPFDEYRLAHDDEYNLLIGTTYLNQMLNMYGGDEMLAAAAYNAGPGSVNRWLKEIGDPRLGQISYEEFAARIPFKETRGYVEKVMGAAGPPTVRPVSVNMSRDQFNARKAEGLAWAQMNFPGDLNFQESFINGMEQEYNDTIAEHNLVLEQNYDSVFDAVITADEDGKYMNQSQFNAILESNAAFAEQFNSLDPTKRNTIQAQLRTNDNINNEGASAITDESLSEYDRLVGLWTNDNASFKKEDIAANPILTQPQKKELIDKKGQEPPSAKTATPVDINMTKALRVAGPSLAAIELTQKSDPQKYNTFVGALRRILDEETTQKGRQLTDVEMADIVQNLLTEQVVKKPWGPTLFGMPAGVSTKEFYTFEDLGYYPKQDLVGSEVAPLLEPQVPQNMRQTIIQQYTTKYGSAPTPALINQIYFNWLKNQAPPK